MKKQVVMVIIISFLQYPLAAQPGNNTPVQPFIEVIGDAAIEIIPDEIYVDVTIREKYQKNNKISIEEQEAKLMQALQASGIDQKNIVSATNNAVYIDRMKKMGEVFAGKDFVIKANNTNAVANLFMQLDKLKINEVKIAYTTHSRVDSIIQAVKTMALRTADTKVQYLLDAVGAKKGNVIEISEMPYRVSSYSTDTDNTHKYYQKLRQAKIIGIEQVEYKLLKIEAKIYARYSII